MSAWATVASVLEALAKLMRGDPPSPSPKPVGGLPGDVGSAVSAAATLIGALLTRTADLQTAETAVNAVQQVLVDAGLEPPQVQQAVLFLEWIAPTIRELYATGVITGGVPAAFPPGGGPGPYRSR